MPRQNAYTFRELRWAWRVHRILTYPTQEIASWCLVYEQMMSYFTRRYLGIQYHHENSAWKHFKFQWQYRHSED